MRSTRGDVEAEEAMTEMADVIEEMWAASVKRDRERRRRKHSAWYEFYSRLAENHARISQEFERRALALLDEPGGTER